MDDYLNITLARSRSRIDFHFYSFLSGVAYEIANYKFEDVSGNFQYLLSTDGKGEQGRLFCQFHNSPKIGWFKGQKNTNMFKFMNLMESTLFCENVDSRQFFSDEGANLFPHFMGITIFTQGSPVGLDNKNPPVALNFPSGSLQNLDLTGYNYAYGIPSEYKAIVETDAYVPGAAVQFTDVGFRVSMDNGKPTYLMDSKFVPFAYEHFESLAEKMI